MATLVEPAKAATVNSLKLSTPLGGALAFMGLDGCFPLFHGAQGCTAFALVLAVRHFRESIPFQTTALDAVTTVLGGYDNLEQALLNIHGRAKPKVIGICSTSLTETRGEDIPGDLKLIRERHPELDEMAIVFASTPDFRGGFEQGWTEAVTAMVRELARPAGTRDERAVNILAGCHLTAGDLEEIRDLVEAFGLEPTILPDISGSLDGHVPDRYIPTTYGGTGIEAIHEMGRARLTIALGEHMRKPAEALEEVAGVPFVVCRRLTGLAAVDNLVAELQTLSGRPAPMRLRRWRSQLVDAMLDGHFFFGGKRIAIAAEPDMLLGLGAWLGEMGAIIEAAVSPTPSALLSVLPVEEVVIGDLDDLELRAGAADLLIASSQAGQAAGRLHLPLFRIGFPVTDRLGAAQLRTVGYRGTRDLVFSIGNILMERDHAPASTH